MAKKTTVKIDAWQKVTDRIIEYLEAGQIPWKKPWKNKAGAEGLPFNLASKNHYNGINIFTLSMEQALNGYSTNAWMTFKQAKDLGGNVKKGEKGSVVVFFKWLEKEGENAQGEKEINKIPLLRYAMVFNADQVENIDPKKLPQVIEDEDGTEFDPIAAAEAIVDGYKMPPIMKTGGNRACYAPFQDVVTMPERKQFKGPEEFYCTLFHELIHSTGHHERLDRFSKQKNHNFGSQDYSKEELVAELGAAYLCNEAGIVQTTIENSAAYIQGWLKALKNDKRMIVFAATAAQKAASHILGS